MVDDALEQLLRVELPLSERVGDVVFEAPSSSWSAQLSRLTVNMFLYEVRRSSYPPQTPTQRVDASGRLERRPPQPMVALSYLVSTWAGSPRDEHQLLGEVVNRLATVSAVPAKYLPADVISPIQLSFGSDDRDRPREIWAAIGGQMKASFICVAHVAADSYPWSEAATAVQQVEVLMPPGHNGVASR